MAKNNFELVRMLWVFYSVIVAPCCTVLQENCDESDMSVRRRLLDQPQVDIIKLRPGNCNSSVLLPSDELRIWLFSTVSCDDKDGWVMFQHWYRHYLAWGFAQQHILLVVHRNTSSAASDDLCRQFTEFLTQEGIAHTHWHSMFSAAAHVKIYLKMLQHYIQSPYDWVAYADSDEFHDYGVDHFSSVERFARWLEENDYDAAKGRFQDHLCPGGALTRLSSHPSIWEQYPVECDLLGSNVFERSPVRTKTMLYRAYFRTGNGNHEIIPIERANWYFGPHPHGTTSPRNENYGSEDLRQYTPYYMYNGCYVNSNTLHPKDHHSSGHSYLKGWPREYREGLLVHHFKWHEGVIESVKRRINNYAGDMYVNGTWYWDKKPKIPVVFNYMGLLKSLKTNRTVPMENATCLEESVSSERSSKFVERLAGVNPFA